MIYGSVCSGIEAASVAWEPLGWQPAWFSEIEMFPSTVLAQRWPEVANLGDMTKIATAVRAGDVEAPDAVVGGTPCQAFSVAGLRNGLSDARGQLTLSYLELANAIDDKRRERKEPVAIFVWENVPGVLSSKDNAFGCFLAGLAGESCTLESPGRKWNNAGYVLGPQRAIAWRVLDAQFFGVAQRRRRVFVVASAREGFDPASVLFEFESVRRDTPPRREPQTTVAALTANGVGTCGADDNQGQAGHLIAETQYGEGVAGTLTARHDSSPCADRRMNVLVYGGSNTSGNIDVAACLTAKGQRIDFDVETFAVHGTQDPGTNHEVAHPIGRNNGAENACIAFSYKDNGADATIDMSPTLRAGNHDTSHANSGQPPAIAYSVALRGREGGATAELGNDAAGILRASTGGGDKPHALIDAKVRRLTPRECERLQGFPDDHTLIEYGRKVSPEKMDRDFAKYLMRGGKLTFEECCGRAADGPRYKAIGNSMAVPVMRWIGQRIEKALSGENK